MELTQHELNRYNFAMNTQLVQHAYRLLTYAAEKEYKTARGELRFLCDCQDAAASHRRWNWHRTIRPRLIRRTSKRPMTRAAMLCYFVIFSRMARLYPTPSEELPF